MELHVRVDFSQVDKMFEQNRKQLPYTLSTTINKTLMTAQTDMYEQALQEFIVRRPHFIKNAIKITQFASKSTLTGILAIADVGGKPNADVLSKFEDGGTKTSDRGGKVAIPTNIVRSGKTDLVTKAKRPRNLRGGFKIHTKTGQDLIMQKKGRGKNSTVKVAYVLKDSVPIDNRLGFTQTVTDSINKNIERNFAEAYAKAMSTAR